MRKKGFYLLLPVLVLSLFTCVFGAITPKFAAAETAKSSTITAWNDNQVVRENKPEGVSALATPIRNLWGAPKGENVDVVLSKTDGVLSWRWSRPSPVKPAGADYIQPIFPNARITLKSPVEVGDIQSFNLFADYVYTQKPTGSYNLAYDIFLREPGSGAHKAEIMVWLDGTQKQPPCYQEGKCSDGYNDYTKYWWTTSDNCAYRSFLLEPATVINHYQVNLRALIGIINPEKNWYISEVELGTEIWNGSGNISLTAYHLELNGDNF